MTNQRNPFHLRHPIITLTASSEVLVFLITICLGSELMSEGCRLREAGSGDDWQMLTLAILNHLNF